MLVGLGFAVLVLLLLGIPFGIFKASNYNDANLNKQLPRTITIGILTLIVLFFEPINIQRIDAGSVGLKIDRVGNNKGIPVIQPVKGWVWYNAWTTDVIEYSIKQNHVSYQGFVVTTKGGFPLTVAPSFNYALKPEKAGDLYINLLKGSNFSSLESNFLSTATQLSLNNASNFYPIDSIFNNKQGYNAAVAAELNRELSAYFVVTQINPGTVAPPELKDVIVAKTNAIQSAQRAQLEKITAENNAQTKIANARGDSAQLVISAQAEAVAIKLKTSEISPTYVEYVKWVNAGTDVPRVPATILGSNTGYLFKQ